MNPLSFDIGPKTRFTPDDRHLHMHWRAPFLAGLKCCTVPVGALVEDAAQVGGRTWLTVGRTARKERHASEEGAKNANAIGLLNLHNGKDSEAPLPVYWTNRFDMLNTGSSRREAPRIRSRGAG